MLPCYLATNGALSGGVQLAAFVQQQQHQHQHQGPTNQHLLLCKSSVTASRRGSSSSTTSAAAACGLLVVASAYCPPRPRSGRLQACASRSKTRRRRSGGATGGGDDDGDLNAGWPFLDGWDSSLLCYGNGDNSNGSGGNGGGSWHHGNWGSSDDAFHNAVYHGIWLWQLLCAASLLRSLYFLLFADTVVSVDAATAAANLHQVAMAC